jgi:hypothetical protein
MKRQLTAAAVKDYTEAPPAVQNAFDKQVKLLVENFRHPSLRAKEYDESRNIWQARVNRDWRFYFLITGDTHLIFRLAVQVAQALAEAVRHGAQRREDAVAKIVFAPVFPKVINGIQFRTTTREAGL